MERLGILFGPWYAVLNDKCTEQMLFLRLVVCPKLGLIYTNYGFAADDDIFPLVLCNEFVLIPLEKFEFFFEIFVHLHHSITLLHYPRPHSRLDTI